MSEQTSEAARKPRSRWRKVLWILLGIFIVPPALILLILFILIQVNRVRPDQMQPPAGMIETVNTHADQTISATLTTTTTPHNFDEVLAASSKPQLAEIYKKLAESGWDKSPFVDWNADQPLTAEQIEWLKNNQAVIDELMKLAKLGGSPIMTYEEARRLDVFSRIQPPTPNLLQHQVFARILSAEAIRRMDSGDEQGATDALLAVHPIAHLIREPMMISHIVAVAMQTTADHQLAKWINEGKLSPDAARRLHDSLPGQALTATTFRRSIEAEYRSQRDMMLHIVNGSVTQTWRIGMSSTDATPLMDQVSEQMHKSPLMATAKLAALTGISLVWKADGSRMVQRLDSSFQATFQDMDNNRQIKPAAGKIDMFNMVRLPYFNEIQVRANANTALLNVDVAGLDVIAGGTGGGMDPFNNQPLKTISESESTLIYSIGPDGVDQRGAVTFDPTNGAMSAGDIWVRVRKK